MIKPTIDEILDEVERLDGDASTNWRTGRKVGRTLYSHDQLIGVLDTHLDAECAAYVRNHAPALVAEVRRLRADVATYEALSKQELDKVVAAERARLDVPYRPGLPSVEQVRAHGERGGLWLTRRAGDTERCWILKIWAASDGERIASQSSNPSVTWLLTREQTRYEMRPCSTDGTPISWADRPGIARSTAEPRYTCHACGKPCSVHQSLAFLVVSDCCDAQASRPNSDGD